MATNFTQKISMNCTKEQYENYLKDELLKMGYKEYGLDWGYNESIIVNNWAGFMGDLASLNPTIKTDNGRLYLGSFNPELFLALAAMTDNPTGNYREIFTNGIKFITYPLPTYTVDIHRKATKDEIMEILGNNKLPMWESCSNIINNLEELYTAINLLKSNGYKIMRRKETWEEV